MNLSYRNIRIIALAVLLSASTAIWAHDPKARYGGRVEHAGNFHVELVSKGKAIEAYLLGHDDKPMKADGYKGLAILVVGGKSERVPLVLASDGKDGNKLAGAASVDLPPKPRGVIQFTNPEGKAFSAKFD